MKNNIKIAVIGGTGKSGNYLIRELLRQSYNFKILVRNPENFQLRNPLMEIVEGNVNNSQTVRDLIRGCDAVISTLGIGIPQSKHTIFTTATQNIVKAMKELGLRRYVVITGLHVDTPFDKKGPKTKMATEWMYANYPTSTKDKQKEYELLVESELDWTLVRLPLIDLTDEHRPIEISLEDCLGEKISATSLAHFLIGQLTEVTYIRKAPFIANAIPPISRCF